MGRDGVAEGIVQRPQAEAESSWSRLGTPAPRRVSQSHSHGYSAEERSSRQSSRTTHWKPRRSKFRPWWWMSRGAAEVLQAVGVAVGEEDGVVGGQAEAFGEAALPQRAAALIHERRGGCEWCRGALSYLLL